MQPPRITRYTVIGIKVTVKPPTLLSRLISSTLHMAVVWMWLLQVWYHCWQREWARKIMRIANQSSKFKVQSFLKFRTCACAVLDSWIASVWARESGTSHWLTTYRIISRCAALQCQEESALGTCSRGYLCLVSMIIRLSEFWDYFSGHVSGVPVVWATTPSLVESFFLWL